MNTYAVELHRTPQFSGPSKTERTVTASAIDVAARKVLRAVRRTSYYKGWRVTGVEELSRLVR